MSPAPKRVLKNSGKTKSTPPKSKKEDLVKLVTGEEKKEVNVAGIFNNSLLLVLIILVIILIILIIVLSLMKTK